MNNNTDLLKEYASLAGKEDEKSETRKTEILNYIKTKEPMDKAGAYAVQGKGSAFVEKLNGDYFAVVGFPCCYVNTVLNKLGIFPKN